MGSPSPIGCFENKPDPVIIVDPPSPPPRPPQEPKPDIIWDPPNPDTNGNNVVDPVVEPPITPSRPKPSWDPLAPPPRPPQEPRPDVIWDPPNPDVPPRPEPRPDVPPRPRPKPSTPPRPTPSTYDGCGCNEPVSSSGSQECKKYLWQYMNEPRPLPNGTTTTTTTTNETINNEVVTETLIYGCTDPTYASYNPNANIDDGSCTNVGFDPPPIK